MCREEGGVWGLRGGICVKGLKGVEYIFNECERVDGHKQDAHCMCFRTDIACYC